MAFAKCDIPGLEYHSSVMGHLFKSGFGIFFLRHVLITHCLFLKLFLFCLAKHVNMAKDCRGICLSLQEKTRLAYESLRFVSFIGGIKSLEVILPNILFPKINPLLDMYRYLVSILTAS